MNLAEDYSGCTKIIPVGKNGVLDIDMLKQALEQCKYTIPLVSIQYANNEIGTIQDMAAISKVVHAYGGILHTDATQIIPDRKIDVAGIDMMSFSGQKLGAPKGIGVLYVRDGIQLQPLIYGAQERSRRGGTENVPYISGLAEAVKHITYPNGEIRDYFVERVLNEIPNSYLVGCVGDNRLRNNASICFKGVSSEYVVIALDQVGICVSSGSACNMNTKGSYVLDAIGLGDDTLSVVRFTFGDNTKEEIDYVVDNCAKIIKRVRND
jgi:cysteine desulfurase